MYEYVFFNDVLCGRFMAALMELGQPYEQRGGSEGHSVLVDEDIDDDMMERLEELYDALMDEQRLLLADEERDDADVIDRVGVQYSDPDGRVGQVHLDPDLVNRVLREMAIDELQALVQTVATQVLAGGAVALCKRP